LSDTEPPEGILNYPTWLLELNGDRWAVGVEEGRIQGRTLVAKLAGSDDRDQATAFRGAAISVHRDELDDRGLREGEYFWTDLEGLSVETQDGVLLGEVVNLFETGANDVMVVRGERERLLPYLWQQVVLEVDLDSGRMVVNWDPAF